MHALARYLAKKKKTPTQLAAELDLKPSTITRILNGERTPSPRLAEKIHDATGVSLMALVFPNRIKRGKS